MPLYYCCLLLLVRYYPPTYLWDQNETKNEHGWIFSFFLDLKEDLKVVKKC